MTKLKELADLVGGELLGDGEVAIARVAPIEAAGAGDITFVANPKYLTHLANTKASAAIVAPGVAAAGELPLIVCANPYLAFAKVLTRLQGQKPAPLGILPGAHIASTAQLADEVTVHPGCCVAEKVKIGKGSVLYPGVILYAGVEIGEDCILHGGVVVREGCRIGNRVVIQPNAVIGSDGFGYAPDGSRYFKIPQVGIVILEDDVEIGAATCVDRATLGATIVKRGVKLDNLVQIAHNVVVGEDTIMVSQVGVAGSTQIGRHCTFGGQVGTAGHIKIGDNVTIGARGGATGNVEGNQVLSGVPLMPHKEWLKSTMSFAKLPEMRKDLAKLKKRLEELEDILKER